MCPSWRSLLLLLSSVPALGNRSSLKDPKQSVAVWVGGFRLKLNSGTTGSINLSELFDLTGLQGKVDNGIQAVGQKQAAVETWWDGLTPAQQQNPVNIAKYETANRALGAAGNFLNTMDQALNDDQTASVQYSLDKRPERHVELYSGSSIFAQQKLDASV